jgi:hypothetical protein
MRRVASFLLCGVAFAAGAADIWRWKDANGVTHYSDSPVPGAERVNVSRGPRPVAAEAGQPGEVATATAQPAVPVNYTRCAISEPANDTVFQAVDAVSVSIAIEPEVQPGHQVLVLLNGGAYGEWPQGALSHTLTGLFRGSYTLAVRVVDENDRPLCSGRVVNFHVRQTSVQSPARQPAKPPPKK